MASLHRLQVIDHDLDPAVLRSLGVVGRPTPMQMLLVVKANGKYKCRFVLNGSPRFCPKDIFSNTYAAAPKIESGRIFVAIAVYFRMYMIMYDVSTAFLHAECKPNERIAVC